MTTLLNPPEIVRAPTGRGWTAVRGGRDELGNFEAWIGQHFPTYAEAEAAALAWEIREPSTNQPEESPQP
jgi:hypothetical protein